MSKKIILTGKKTLDKLNNVKPVRSSSKKWINNSHLLNKDKQTNILNQIYLEQSFENDNFVKQELEKKRKGYKNQDIKKKIYDIKDFITYNEMIEKLVISKLTCYYCRCKCLLMYDNVREKKQWTLDRLDNNMGHSSINTVVCCLECNLKRGTLNDEKFKFTKQLNIVKKYF
tara:strand:+ start:697 stop:1212 length:516 start_codon:yes stop_codon:yes gene_type:complete